MDFNHLNRGQFLGLVLYGFALLALVALAFAYGLGCLGRDILSVLGNLEQIEDPTLRTFNSTVNFIQKISAIFVLAGTVVSVTSSYLVASSGESEETEDESKRGV